jgi:hypothetical protein
VARWGDQFPIKVFKTTSPLSLKAHYTRFVNKLGKKVLFVIKITCDMFSCYTKWHLIQGKTQMPHAKSIEHVHSYHENHGGRGDIITPRQ